MIFSEDNIKRLGFSVLTTVLSFPNMDQLYRESGKEPKYRDPDILDIFNEFYDDGMLQDLLSFSALIRAADDNRPFLNKFSDKLAPSIEIIELEGYKKTNIREACNKIIHAGELKYIDAQSKSNPLHEGISSEQMKFMNPKLGLKGDKFGKQWDASIYIIPFVVFSIEAYGMS